MKHCPECNRNYADPTLSFCLNDGAPLVFGSAVEEPDTAIISGDFPSEAPTRHIDPHTTEPTQSFPYPTTPAPAKRNLDTKAWLAGAVALALVAAACVFAYRYFNTAGSQQIESVAVLPFENGSGDPNLDYLSDGLSETLIDKLSELPQLKVIARSSSFKYRGTGLDLQDIANKLGVRAIVTGKVARLGDNLNVRVEMIDAANNRQLWSEQYDRKATDLISVQREISQTASDKLRLKLSGSQEQQLSKPGTVDAQAYELLLKGKFYENKGGTENRKRANDYFQQAVARDPNYALAYAELADSYAGMAASSEVDQKDYLNKAEAAARKGLELDENLPDTHTALGFIYLHAWNWAAAEQEYKRAIELNPNLPHAHGSYAAFLSRMCRHDEAVREATLTRDLDPLSLESNRVLGYRLYHARRYDEAIAVFKKLIEMDPNYDAAYGLMAYCHVAKGQFKDAIAAFYEAIRLGDKSTSIQVYLGEAYASNGERQKAEAILKELQNTKEYVSPGELAVLYGALGDKEGAFASLNKAYADHDLQLQFLKVDPSYDRLRDDPRFQELLQKVGLA
jgi:TolB-like protein/Tfp pilus assembly protein PilF